MFEFKPGHFTWYEEIISFFLTSFVVGTFILLPAILENILAYLGL